MIKVFNINGIVNQFQLSTNKGYIFQSYDSLCACEFQGQDYINERYYKYSVTTSSTAKGMRPIGWGCQYRIEREDQ